MIKYHGKQVCEGIAIGKLYWHHHGKKDIKKRAVIDIAGELERLEYAVSTADKQLRCLYEKTVKEAGKEQALIFEIHRMMLEDADYLNTIKEMITEGVNAEYAVFSAEKQFVTLFAAMDDVYMKERAVDIQDISQRLIDLLSGSCGQEIHTTEPVVLLAEDITPSEIISLNREQILALITRKGSVNSHAAILAKGKNLPMMVNAQIPNPVELDGKLVIADCFEGEIYVEPEKAVVLEMSRRKELWNKKQQELLRLKGKNNITKDGRSIKIYANIGNEKEVSDAIFADAGGIGLFRSEYLYMDRTQPPSEEEQFQSYKSVLEQMPGKRVVIRTVDIGADKQVPYLLNETEQNPALGCRGIRLCFEKPDILMTQLRAIYRSSFYGNVAMMFPMVISVEEVKILKKMAKDAKEQLIEEGFECNDVPIGIMIETPAAALLSERLAKEADFFSIGTNDLIQYTLAIDRQNSHMEDYYNEVHPAVLQLIEMTVQNAHKAGIEVSICGELAGDIMLTKQFIDMGVNELSVPPVAVLKVRKAVIDS